MGNKQYMAQIGQKVVVIYNGKTKRTVVYLRGAKGTLVACNYSNQTAPTAIVNAINTYCKKAV